MVFHRLHNINKEAIRLKGEKSTALEQARGRLFLISAFFILAFMLMGVRAADVSVLQVSLEDDLQAGSSLAPGVVSRGNIYDKNGVLLATSLEMFSLYADAKLIEDPKKVAQGLVKIFPDLSYTKTLQKLSGKSRFSWIKRNITPKQQAKVLHLGQPGLQFKAEDKRVYPQGNMAAHLLGYTDIDGNGLSGVERSYNENLLKGENLYLSLDSRIQHSLSVEVKNALEVFKAKAASALVLDVRTGDVVAGLSLPDYDPNFFQDAPSDALFNRLTLGVYELGSMFKIFSTAALLEHKDMPMHTGFDASQPIKIGRFTINDYHAKDRELSIPEVFMYSSNIGSALMGQMVGTQKLKDFYADLGLLSPLEFDIAEIGKPILPNPWREVSTLTTSYGHGIATSPLQMTVAVGSIVNGGYALRPRLVLTSANSQAEIKNPESKQGNISQEDEFGVFTNTLGYKVVRPETSHRMRQLLRLVVSEGTAKNADVPGYRVGGKTGTAEKIGENGYDKDRLVSSFVGVFPMEDPQYAVLVMLDEPQGNKQTFGYATGGWVSAPTVANVITRMASVLSIPAKTKQEVPDIGQGLKKYIRLEEKD